MSVKESLHLIRDHNQFVKLAAEVSQKREAAKAKTAAAPAQGTTLTPANDGPSATMTVEPHKAAAPMAKIELDSVANDGRIEARQKALG